MRQKRCLVILGTRPEVIKMGPVIRALEADERAECVVCLTGQHEELLESALELFDIKPQHRLRVMAHGQRLGSLTALILAQLEPVIEVEKPDWVVVQGDTASALAASLAGFYAKIPVVHVEAGLRSHDDLQPFPEEMNRKLIDTISALHFAPTPRDEQALIREGISAKTVYVCGNTGIDALQYVASLPVPAAMAQRYAMLNKRLLLVSTHRRENHGEGVESICHAIRSIAERYKDSVHVMVPVHPNQQVFRPLHRLLGEIRNVTLTAPLGYQEMILAMCASYLVITDSGGLQEELPSLGKPALVLRNVTDRPEAMDAGAAKLVGTDTETIIASVTELLENPTLYRQMARQRQLFGDGRAAQRIVNVLLQDAGERRQMLPVFPWPEPEYGDPSAEVA